jgi:hypothetical protein
MRLRWVIPAKWVELDGDGDAIITNAGVDAIYVWEFPAPARVILGINVCRPAMAFAKFSVWVTVDGPDLERVDERQVSIS